MEMMPNNRDSLFQKSYELTAENNKLLKQMRRNQRLTTIVRIIYWLVIAGAAVGLYYYIQPFTDPLFEIVEKYGSFRAGLTNVLEFFGSASSTPSQ